MRRSSPPKPASQARAEPNTCEAHAVGPVSGPTGTGYPRLHLSVYFDSVDANTGESCSLGNKTFRPGPPYSDTPAVADGGPSNEPMWDAYIQPAESAVYPVRGQRPICLLGLSKGSGLRTPERSPGILEACGGLSSPPPAAPKVRTFPLSNTRYNAFVRSDFFVRCARLRRTRLMARVPSASHRCEGRGAHLIGLARVPRTHTCAVSSRPTPGRRRTMPSSARRRRRCRHLRPRCRRRPLRRR